MLEYIRYKHATNLRPAGAALVYLMGLLRVADFLQLDADRAPVVLLRLKRPASPQSVQEWRKHAAVANISWHDADQRAITIEVGATHGLRTHMQLRAMLSNLQAELDITSAVLSEVYSGTAFQSFQLARSRVSSNLDIASLHQELAFAPTSAKLRSAEDLFRLLIAHLYGNRPGVAGRELTQNAVDAVRERRRVEALRGLADEARPPVTVAIEECRGGGHILRVTDRGVGMTPHVIAHFFLNAGASYGPPRGEMEALDPQDAIGSLKAGRFGIGAFAGFLLGPTMRVTTRHLDASRGVAFEVAIDGDLVEMRWAPDLPVGTEIEIPFCDRALPSSSRSSGEVVMDLLKEIAAYCWLTDPRVDFEYVPRSGVRRSVRSAVDLPTQKDATPDHWRGVDVDGFDWVVWRVPGVVPSKGLPAEGLAHNGIAVRAPLDRATRVYRWTTRPNSADLKRPLVGVFDRRHMLALTLDRSALLSTTLPFEDGLFESFGYDVLAHALAASDRRHPLGAGLVLAPVYADAGWMPMASATLAEIAYGEFVGIFNVYDTSYGKGVGWEDDDIPTHEALAGVPFPWRTHAFVPHHGVPTIANAEKIAARLGVSLGCEPQAHFITFRSSEANSRIGACDGSASVGAGGVRGRYGRWRRLEGGARAAPDACARGEALCCGARVVMPSPAAEHRVDDCLSSMHAALR